MVVDIMKSDPLGKDAISAEMEDILDAGLMSLAGRVAAQPMPNADQPDLFREGRPKAFTDLRSDIPGEERKRMPTAQITLRQWLAQPPRPLRNKATRKTSDETVGDLFNEMQAAGCPEDMTLGEYVRTRR